MHSISGRFEAYNAEIAVEMQYGSRGLDTGTIMVAVPDTAWSRDPNSRWPFLLGLEGFFDRLDVRISHAKKSFCLGGVGDWAKDENGVGRDKGHPLLPISQSRMPTAAKPSQ